MDINATSSANSAGVQAQRSQSAQVQQSEPRQPKVEERTEPKQEAQQPVTNAQGQTTGTLINVTA